MCRNWGKQHESEQPDGIPGKWKAEWGIYRRGNDECQCDGWNVFSWGLPFFTPLSYLYVKLISPYRRKNILR